jgi:hypothetical protein
MISSLRLNTWTALLVTPQHKEKAFNSVFNEVVHGPRYGTRASTSVHDNISYRLEYWLSIIVIHSLHIFEPFLSEQLSGSMTYDKSLYRRESACLSAAIKLSVSRNQAIN